MADQGSSLISSISHTVLSAFSHSHSALSSQPVTLSDPILEEFDNSLAQRLHQLKSSASGHEGSFLNLPWLNQALENVLITHSDVEDLIRLDSDLPASPSHELREERWVGEYLDDSAKLLDVCNAFKHKICEIKAYCSQLLFAIHLLDLALQQRGSFSVSHAQCRRARNALMDCFTAMDNNMNEAQRQGKQLKSCGSMLRRVTENLCPPSVRSTTKPFISAIYGAKLNTVFVCSLLEAAFAPAKSHRPLCGLRVPTHSPWSASLIILQHRFTLKVVEHHQLEIKGKASITKPRLNELACVAATLKQLLHLLDDPLLKLSQEERRREELRQLAGCLQKQAKEFGEGLEILERKVKDLYRMIVNSRMALLNHISHSN